ncbi:MAG: MBL fold metallo-hydrolase [Desulfurococcales archaeon]|nr:MBL fold metallo-hydrolase [Desulfurococcales archaeon]
MSLDRLVGNTYLMRGSPSTLIYEDSESVYVIDPGHGRKRAKQLSKELVKMGKPLVIFITHYHSDHFSLLAGGRLKGRIIATNIDAPAIRDPRIRVALTFGLPLSSGDPLLLYEAVGIDVDETIDPQSSLGPLKLVFLPGHTPGQAGVLTPDGVLYAADSLFGDRVLDNYGVPYHFNPCMALDSLKHLLDISGEVNYLVPSHGPVVGGDGIKRLVEVNIGRLEDAWRLVREMLTTSLTISEIAGKLASSYGVEPSPSLLLLLETAVRGYISCMRDKVEAVIEEGVLKWRLKTQ